MTENEAMKKISEQICNEKGPQRYCRDSCIHGAEHCAYSMAIKALEEIQQYRAIGTVEEFKALKEKAEPKKPKQSGVTDNKGVFHAINGINGVPYDLCPCCEKNLCTDVYFGRDKKSLNYCENCGQKLDLE